MILQRLSLRESMDDSKELYYKNLGRITCECDQTIHLQQDAIIDLRTYFNMFAAFKWRKYTSVDEIRVAFRLKGKVELVIENIVPDGHKQYEMLVMNKQVFMSETEADFVSDMIELPQLGTVGIRIRALEDSSITDICYVTEDDKQQNPVELGLGICTFRREEYVKNNIELLKRELLDNQEAVSYGHVSVCVSDNAGTLQTEELEGSGVRVVQNKNLGGVGGFTRTMLEFMHAQKPVTHVVFMDDDAVISTEAIERIYMFLSLLKPEYEQYIIGGALMRADSPTVQYESGALWNDGDMLPNNHGFNMTRLECCVHNEKESDQDYTGWWFSCIPIKFVEKNHLPLPLFIHRDDIEYGIRAEHKFIFMNGVCVWHEAFENKCPGLTEYYDVRNLAIINAIHEEAYSAKMFKRMLFKQISSNIGKYRYKYVDLNLIGALDFLRGAEWFKEYDVLKRHADISKYNYEMISKQDVSEKYNIPLEKLSVEFHHELRKIGKFEKYFKTITFNGHFFPAKKKDGISIPYPNIYDLFRYGRVFYVDSTGKILCAKRSIWKLIESYIKFFKVCRLIDQKYDQVCAEFRKEYDELVSDRYWNQYLGLNRMEEDNGKN